NQSPGTTVGTLTATDPNPGDTLTFSLVAGTGGDDNAAFAIAGTQLQTAAVLDFETKASYSIRVGVSDGHGGTFERQFSITVVNSAVEPPVVRASAGTTAYTEGAAPVAIDAGLGVTDDDGSNVTGATVRISGGQQAGDELAFSNQNGISASFSAGVLTLTGTASAATYQAALRTVTYRHVGDNPSAAKTAEFVAADAGGPGPAATRAIAVTAVNDPPAVATSVAALTYNENAGAVAIDPGLTVTDPDAAQLTGATVTIQAPNFVTLQDTLGFVNQSGISGLFNAATGVLSLTGSATVAAYQAALRSVTYTNASETPSTLARTIAFQVDDGVATSNVATRTVTVVAADDAPVAAADNATVLEDSVATAVAVLTNDTDVDAGPKTIASASDPLHGTVVLTGGSPGAHTGLTYQPDANYCNTPPGAAPDTFTYTINGGSSATVSMTVTCVNDAPVADDETFGGAQAAVGNTALIGDDPSDGAPALAAAKKTISGDILDGDADVDGPGPLVVTAGTFASNDGGSVTIEADGDFIYTPAAGTSCSDTSDSFDYTISDQNPGTAGTDVGRVTISISGCVWYVSNNAAGNAGTSTAPFDTLAQAESASAAGHTIFVFDGDNTTTGYGAGIDLKANQRLLGETATLQIGADVLYAGVAANRPTITDNNADVVSLASGNTVRGVQIDPQGTGGGVAGGAGDAGGTIDDVRIIDAGTAGTQPGLELNGVTGTFDVSSLTVDSSAATGTTAGSVGVLLNGAFSANFASAGTISITTKGAKGLDATATAMGAGSVFDDIAVTASASGGVSMVNTTGTTTFGDGSGTDLSLTTTSGAAPAFLLSNAGTVSVPAPGTANASATGGPAIDVSGTTITSLTFDTVTSSASTGAGIRVAGLGAAPFTANASSSISDAGGIDFDLDGGSGAVTYDGAITDNTGQLVRVQNTSGGLKDFNGAIGGVAGAAGGNVGLSSNTGATIRFDGGVKLSSSGATPALGSTGGGTLAVTDPAASNNTLGTTTSTGQALNVVGTTVSDDDLTFESVRSNTAASGIVLSSTSNANGRLVVTGAGGTCSTAANCTGGAIQSSTGAGIALTSVPGGVSLTRVAVTSGADDGIRATTVNDVDLADSVVTNNGNSHAGGAEERGLDYLNVTGTPQVLRTTVSGSDDSNAHIRNTVAGSTTLSVDQSTFSGSKFNAGLRLRGEGASVMNATVVNSFFTLNADPGFSMQTDSANTAQQTLLFSTNELSGGSSNAVSGRPQVSINADSASVVKATVTNNKIKSAAGAEVILNTLANHTGTFDAKVNNNSIGDAQPGVLDALADGGSAIWGWAHGDGVSRMEIRNNTIANWGGRGMELSHNDGTGDADYTVTGNVLSNPDLTSNTFEGIYIFSGGAAGDASDVCVDMENNDMDGIGRQGVSDIALDRFTGNLLRFADFNDTSVANLQSNLRTKNPLSSALTVETFSFGPTATPDTACDLPVGTP
ncbi:MAG: hypothetical protein QOG94_1476, partial [Solirubrobacteraceae bacterium]|nr:hypothetical protein [Solirubrobacteraceae bacterium]